MRPILLAVFLLVTAACAAGPTTPSSTPRPATPLPTATTAPTAESPDPVEVGFDLQGHRGARGLRPENTLPSFERALELGVDTLEVDLHLSADDIPIIWHDPVITPDKCGLAPDAPAGLPDPDDLATPRDTLAIRALTADQLAHYRCDRNPEPGRFPDQEPAPGAVSGDAYHPPGLDELFDFVAAYGADDVRFNLETKRRAGDPRTIGDGFDGVEPGTFERAIVEIIRARGEDFARRVTIQSFDHRSLWAIRRIAPELALAALTNRGTPDLEELVARGATIWSPSAAAVNSTAIEQAHALGLRVIPWTINDPGVGERLREMGVDGLITDRPDIVRR